MTSSRVGLFEREQPRASLGIRATSQAETLVWLKNPEGLAFLFPVNQMRTDLVFFFLQNEQWGWIVPVFVQVRSGAWEVEDAVSTVSWDGIWLHGKVRRYFPVQH